MEFALSEEQRLLQDSVRRFLEQNAPLDKVRLAAGNTHTVQRSLWAGASELGIPGMLIPEDFGGMGLGFLDAAIVYEMIGRHVAPLPFLGTTVMAPLALMLAGSEAQQEKWLPKIAAGEIVAGVAITEKIGIREDAGVKALNGKLTGKSLFVIDWAEADFYIVADSDHGLHLVLPDAKGLSRRALNTIDKTRSVGELVFDRVAAEPLPRSSADAVARMIDAGRVMLAADTLGAGQMMLEKAVAYAGERKQFGRVIGSFQAVKHLCAEMAAALEPSRSLVWYAAHALDEVPGDARLMACHAKSHLSEVGRFVARTATEVHGGMGFTDLLGLHYWFKRIGLDRQLLGGPELVRLEAARLQGWAA
ncbi:MAG: acyl-CoA dehydrogenase family protein [Parvibaculum sp.]|uniref:acyl-CoA dehydrogenase family protein n=1 Tax=Parvibaculum sp. TaxID=2024848 RepID=UPI002728EF38|nr:acyl-CoA dehydrogenase family protein [Parvibaculum sp.]MDO8839466.1 acyl-CoA dehydrogenase family protein [Parvibaculum sp.]